MSEKRSNNDRFQRLGGECFLELQKYKLRTNLLGCNLKKADFEKYYDYFAQKGKKRLSYAKTRIEEVVRCFEKNAIYLEGLQIRTVNNMIRNFRKRMDLLTNEPTDYNYAKFQKEQLQLLEIIAVNDSTKQYKIKAILKKIKEKDELASKTLDQKLQEVIAPENFEKCVNQISRAETRYCRFYQSFEQSVSNMINQMNSYIDKLSQFYTMWENLGSSLIYELPSERQERIDKGPQAFKTKVQQETQQQIKKKLNSLPMNSNMRQEYERKLYLLQEKENEKRKKLEMGGNLFYKKKGNKGIIKNRNFSLQRTQWYQAYSGQRVPINLPPQILVRDKDEKSFFRYTYEQLHRQTRQWQKQAQELHQQQLDELRQMEIALYDRHHMFYQKKKKNMKINPWNYAPPQLRFSYSYDRTSESYFCILDLPMNLVQKKIQFEVDRQVEMEMMDDNRKKQYNIKQLKINRIDDKKTLLHIGYRFIDEGRQLQYLKSDLCKTYNPQYLPQPLEMIPVDEFSDSDHEMDENYKLLVHIEKQMSQNSETSNKQKTKNLTELKKNFHWFQAKDKKQTQKTLEDSNIFRKFIKVYLPQLQTQQQRKSIEWEASKSLFYYQSDLGYGKLKSQVQQNFFAKIYVIDHNYFVKIEPLLFDNQTSKLKINIFIIEGRVEKLKSQIEYGLSSLGQIIFYIKKLEKIDLKEKEDIILGGVLLFQRQEKYEGVTKVKINFQERSFEQKALEVGQKAFSEFKNYFMKVKEVI